MDYNTCKVLKDANGAPTGQVVTPKAIMLYPSVFEKYLSRGETDTSRARYQTTLIFHKSADLAPLKAAMDAVINEKVAPGVRKTTKVAIPFKKITEEEQPKVFNALVMAGYDPADYPVMVRAANGMKPPIKNADMTDCLDEEQTFSGRFCRANLSFWFYDHKTGGKGISTNLNSMQLLEIGPVLPRAGGGDSDGSEFEAVNTGGDAAASADSVFG